MSAISEPLPIWIRLPQEKRSPEGVVIEPARCRYTGLSKAKIWELAVPNPRNNFKPAVLSVSVEESLADQAEQKETQTAGRQRKVAFVRLIRLRGPSPVEGRLALLDFLDQLSIAQSRELSEARSESSSK